MSSTVVPPREVVVGGAPFSVESIFDSARTTVIMAEDQTNLNPLPTSTVCINDQELDALADTHRLPGTRPSERACLPNGTCGLYHLHVVIVDYQYCRGITRGVLTDAETRASIALFYPMTMNDTPTVQLRTLAHEIGHAFNLHHLDGGDPLATPPDTNLMNITNDIGSPDQQKDWALSSTEIDYIKQHPKACVFPGTGPSTSVYQSHLQHAGVAPTCIK